MLTSYHYQIIKIFISTAVMYFICMLCILHFVFYMDCVPLRERVLLLVLSLYFQEQNAHTCLEPSVKWEIYYL